MFVRCLQDKTQHKNDAVKMMNGSMKACNKSICETCESYGSNSFNVAEYSVGDNIYPTKGKDCLVFLLSGKLSIKNDEIGECICVPERIMLLIRHKSYDITALEPTKVVTLCFISSYQICDKMSFRDVKRLLDSIDYKFCTIEMKEPFKIMMDSILLYLKDNIDCGYWQRAKLLENFVIFWNYYTLEEICNFFYPVINKDIGFQTKVMANCTKAKTVTELAKLCGYSLSAFNKLFAKHFPNSSPYQWMLQQNAPLIKSRLFDQSVPIKAVLAEFGFTDQSYFNTYCKRYFGATAAQIRNGKD